MAEELETAQIPPHIMAAMRERMKMAQRMSRIKHKIVVMSGKGGVGKSTVAANLACVLAENGAAGLVDADVPPGTSDEPLSVAQEIPDADGAVVVTTPQEVSLLDVRKSIAFARAVKMDILGVIENMSGFVCPHCGKETAIFKVGGGEAAAEELGLPFLGRIPLDPRIVIGGDAGKPFVLEHPDSAAAQAFREIVKKLRPRLKETKPRPTGPLAK